MSFPRTLTENEYRLVRWMIEHGDEDPEKYLPQLEQAKVVSQCCCGCATINFQIGDHPTKFEDGIHTISNYTYGDASKNEYYGAFVFTCGGLLAGLEVYSCMDTPAPLPKPEDLRPIEDKIKTAEPEDFADAQKGGGKS